MTKQTDNFGTALYYPFINVQDLDWLKCALLYWDSIRCITPDESYFEDEIKCFRDEGAIIATDPKSYSHVASVKFAMKMEKYCHDQSELDKKVVGYLEEGFPELKNVTIHSDKFSDKVFKKLGHKVFLGHFEKGVSKFYHAQPYITALYLLFLAKEMSNKINAPMVTDVPGLSELGQYILFSEEIIPSDFKSDNMLLQLDIKFPSATDLAHLSFDDILKFRNQRNDERRRFRKAIEEIRQKSHALEDPHALADYFNDKKQEIKQTVDDHQKSLNDIGITHFTSSLIIVGIPLTAICAGKIACSTEGILSAIATISLLLVKSQVAISKERREEIKNCPWHYLINLMQEL